MAQFALWDNAYILNGHQAKDNQRVPFLLYLLTFKLKIMKVLYVGVNSCYGGYPQWLPREFSSSEEFYEKLDKLSNLSNEEVIGDYGGSHPLECSNPELIKLEIADDEDWVVDEYDGMESIYFKKVAEITSKYTTIKRD